MPQIKSNIKTMKTDAKKRAAHAAVRSRIHGVVKKAVAAATTDQKDIALREAQSVIDTAARKGIIHKMLPLVKIPSECKRQCCHRC